MDNYKAVNQDILEVMQAMQDVIRDQEKEIEILKDQVFWLKQAIKDIHGDLQEMEGEIIWCKSRG